MVKYSIQPRPSKGMNAGSKAVNDVSEILSRKGYQTFYMSVSGHDPIYRNFVLLCDLIRLFFKAKKEDMFFIQWPYYFSLITLFYLIVKGRCKRIQMLVHDVNSLREKEHASWDLKFFSLAESIIVHSLPMKQHLVSLGIKEDKIKILTSFDYLTDCEIIAERKNSKTIVFAGNLKKSLFLNSITQENLDLSFNCYGRAVENLGNGLTYKCAFKPEEVSVLEGSWGLVWDGDSLDGCQGVMGAYLRYNAPHKLSLYIVAHLPVIVWKESAMASYVEERGIGICVSSIKDIPDAIANISDSEYSKILMNIKNESDLLRSGKHLLKCLE